jgi:hypothetical protein
LYHDTQKSYKHFFTMQIFQIFIKNVFFRHFQKWPILGHFLRKKQIFLYEIVVLTDLDKIYERKFKIKILVKFKNNSMCSIEMKPLSRQFILDVFGTYKLYSKSRQLILDLH